MFVRATFCVRDAVYLVLDRNVVGCVHLGVHGDHLRLDPVNKENETE